MKPAILSAPFTDALLARFLKYVQIWTTSDSSRSDAGTVPSTERQADFAQLLAQELRTLGVSDVTVTAHSYVCARIPATPGMEDAPAVGFLAHLDTTEEVSGLNVRPNVLENYQGTPIRLADGAGLDPAQDAALARAAGDTIITSDGTTLLGADDKAGIAIIMSAAEELLKTAPDGKPALPHGTVEIVFSPDEETGHGMDHVPLGWFTARQCYTVDGGQAGEIEAECFNAWKSEITFSGKAKHTGTARPDMVNAVTMAADFISFLPRNEAPETTDSYQGFYAPMEITGHLESAAVTLFLRDFDTEGMKQRLQNVETFAQAIEKKFPGAKVSVTHTQQYLNMKEKIDQCPAITENLVQAVRQAGLEPVFKPIRGGTDGARLTEMGIPCPNIFTGGHNYHSRTEWAALSQMAYAVQTVLNLIRLQTGTVMSVSK